MSVTERLDRLVVGLVAACLSTGVAFCVWGSVQESIATTGNIAADHGTLAVHAQATGLVTQMFASVGDHVIADAPLLTLDPNLSAEKLADSENQLSTLREERQRLQMALDLATQTIESKDSHSPGGNNPGVPGDTFNLVNELYAARLELEAAEENKRNTVTHQKSQTTSEIGLVQRNIDLLKRNLEAGRKDGAARESALQAKRTDFAALMKLADKGLVPATDVSRERDALLAAELAVTESRKQVDQIELDISNRTLRISQLRVSGESLAEEANNRINAARLRLDLRAAHLGEHRENLQRSLRQASATVALQDSAVKLGLGGEGSIALRAPVAGVVVSLRVSSVGDAVQAGSEVAMLQPDGVHPVALLHVANKDVGRLAEGQTARVRVDAYPYLTFGTVSGTVARVFAEPDRPDFTAKVILQTPAMRVNDKSVLLLPGLSVHADIFTRRRRIYDLMVHP